MQPAATLAPVQALGIILLIGCIWIGAFWAVAFLRVRAAMKRRTSVRAGLKLAPPHNSWPKVSVIIPAHNEQRVIAECAQGIAAQTYPNLECVFVLDRCTDATRSLLQPYEADERIIVVENDQNQDNWAGKCNAARIGAEHATGEWLLFTDADTRFDPDLCRAAVGLSAHYDLALFSLLSDLTHDRMFHRLAQPVAAMNLMRLFPPVRNKDDNDARPFANGQFLLFDRTWYDRLGGHGAVKDALLEDLAFARLIHRSGGLTDVAMADGMLKCSMYETLPAFIQGWKRIFIEACRRRPARLRRYGIRLFSIGIMAPIAQVAAVAVAAASWGNWPAYLLLGSVITGLGLQAATLARVYRASNAPISSIFLYPAGCWIVGRIMLDAARDLTRRAPVVWAGREYILEPR